MLLKKDFKELYFNERSLEINLDQKKKFLILLKMMTIPVEKD